VNARHREVSVRRRTYWSVPNGSAVSGDERQPARVAGVPHGSPPLVLAPQRLPCQSGPKRLALPMVLPFVNCMLAPEQRVLYYNTNGSRCEGRGSWFKAKGSRFEARGPRALDLGPWTIELSRAPGSAVLALLAALGYGGGALKQANLQRFSNWPRPLGWRNAMSAAS
jgi:hypothetical protein